MRLVSAPVERLVGGIRASDRRSLAQAITLVESTRPDHRVDAARLLDELLPETGQAVRVGISGAPGSGKSTFINEIGVWLTQHGHKVAVLAVDPSSTRSGGSLLGDKTRMPELARERDAFIRPSPSGGTLGGVARRTREAMLVCEAFGFDVVLVETVGVGQSETAVGDMVDCFVLLAAPGGGDDLQGIKRGIMELADVIVVTKADGELEAFAHHAAADYRTAVRLLRHKHPAWEPPVVVTSARAGSGIEQAWSSVLRCRQHLDERGDLATLRSHQARVWLWSELHDELLAQFRSGPAVAAQLPAIERKVMQGELSPAAGAHLLLQAGQGEWID